MANHDRHVTVIFCDSSFLFIKMANHEHHKNRPKGWFHRFLRRKGIKFRKRKSGKKATGEDNIDKIIKVSHVPSFILKHILT